MMISTGAPAGDLRRWACLANPEPPGRN